MHKILLRGVAALALLAALGGQAQAADAADMGAAPYDWSGFYLGAHVGYGDASFGGCIECGADSIASGSALDLNGVVGGGHAGYNFQSGAVVFGLEADATFLNFEDLGLTGSDDEFFNGSVDYLASIRARLGVAMDRTLIYATAGAAFQNAELFSCRDTDCPPGGDTAKFNDLGIVLGGGAEYAATDLISVRAEGLYYIFNDKVDASDFDSGSAGEHVEFEDAFVVRVGATFHFGT